MTPFFGKTKPSEFLQAMVDGLNESGGRPDRLIEMGTYGQVVAFDRGAKLVCAGCAATWTLHALDEKTEPELDAFHYRADGWYYPDGYFREDTHRIRRFEQAIDAARIGTLSDAYGTPFTLESFCELERGVLNPWQARWLIDRPEDLEMALPAVVCAIEEMREAGL